MEERLTLCNLSIELGAKMGMIAPDDTTFEYLERPAATRRRARPGTSGRVLAHPARPIPARVSTGRCISTRATSRRRSPGAPVPSRWSAVDGRIPAASRQADPGDATSMARGARLHGARSRAQPIAGTPIDWVFIGSCTNSRLSDLRAAAAVARGRRVAPRVRAWVVPGSEAVQTRGRGGGTAPRPDRPRVSNGASPAARCASAANGETVAPGQRCVSTSNRNFVGRQGPARARIWPVRHGGRCRPSPAPSSTFACWGHDGKIQRADGDRGAAPAGQTSTPT